MSPLGRPRPLKSRQAELPDPTLPLRLALRDWFHLVRESAEPILKPTEAECQEAYQRVREGLRLADARADEAYHQEAQAFHLATSCCPACGERGESHVRP